MDTRSNIERVGVYVKIKPPTLNEAESRLHPHASTKERQKQSQIMSTFDYNFYTREDPASQQVLYAENAVKGKLLEELLSKQEDLNCVQDPVLEQSRVYGVSRAFSPSSR